MRKNNVERYWQRTRRLSFALLLCWLVVSFGLLFFARELSEYHFFGWSFSFYMAAQGLTLFFLVLLGFFSVYSHRLERQYKKFLKDNS
jgi:putative solute:sodium symporter small subunit